MTVGDRREPKGPGGVFESGSSIDVALKTMTSLFASAGLANPGLDARVLLAHALGIDRRDFLLTPDRRLGAAAGAVAEAARRRLAREPVARILGAWEFWGLPLGLAEATLVPRPDTETVVAAALAEIERAGKRSGSLRILDLGTGSGAILIALLRELPKALGFGIDRVPEAAQCGRANARRNGVGDRALFLVADWAEAIAGRFDVIVCNPPYVARADLTTLEPEVRHHDPALALDGGMDGLDAYRAIIPGAPRLLAPGGRLILELGAGQGDEVRALLGAGGLVLFGSRHDLGGHERAVVAGSSAE